MCGYNVEISRSLRRRVLWYWWLLLKMIQLLRMSLFIVNTGLRGVVALCCCECLIRWNIQIRLLFLLFLRRWSWKCSQQCSFNWLLSFLERWYVWIGDGWEHVVVVMQTLIFLLNVFITFEDKHFALCWNPTRRRRIFVRILLFLLISWVCSNNRRVLY